MVVQFIRLIGYQLISFLSTWAEEKQIKPDIASTFFSLNQSLVRQCQGRNAHRPTRTQEGRHSGDKITHSLYLLLSFLLCFSPSLSLSFPLNLSLPPPSLSPYLSISLALSPSLSLSLFRSLSLPPPSLSLSLFLSLSLPPPSLAPPLSPAIVPPLTCSS